jgi:8-oxo-dGTP diphosphatase
MPTIQVSSSSTGSAGSYHVANSVLAPVTFVRHRIDMADSAEARAPILAAGGIVLREGSRPRIAIVRLRRDKSWVLPKGKLYPGERAIAAAKREVVEETGHEVSVHEFLGSMSYQIDGRIKIIQFWHMRAIGGPVHDLGFEIKTVKWLPLKQAIETLTRAHEKVFLANVGPVALKAWGQSGRDLKPARRGQHKRGSRRSSIAGVEQALASS